jgi:hypothetical protein
MKAHYLMKISAVLVAMGTGKVLAQPTPAPTSGDAQCYSSVQNFPPGDTVVSTPDSQGFYSLFNGTDFTGWWLSGMTGHGGCGNGGAIFRVDQGQKAIYSTQRGSTGGILMTKKKFEHYEIIFDFWPDFGNDGGLFNRTPANGSCFQTVLDYLSGASVGGTWGEAGPPFGGRDFRPFTFSGNENTISVNSNQNYGWTNFTNRDPNRSAYGCNTGCTASDWTRLWDVNNWNEFRIAFYGGTTNQNGPVRMKSWFRRLGVTNYWVPIIADTTVTTPLQANHIGFQVHGGGAFGAARGTWYRNIKWRPLTDKGVPIIPTPTTTPDGKVHFDIHASTQALSGTLDARHEISLFDTRGKLVEKFTGPAGKFHYEFRSQTYGWLSMRIKTAKGTQFRKVHRDFVDTY